MMEGIQRRDTVDLVLAIRDLSYAVKELTLTMRESQRKSQQPLAVQLSGTCLPEAADKAAQAIADRMAKRMGEF